MKAFQQTVDYGTFQMDVLMTENQELYVGVSQFESISSVPQKNASRDLKAILGKDSQWLKLKSDLNPKTVNAVPLEKVSEVLFELAKKGDTKAAFTVKMLLGLSLTQLAYDAFGIKFETIERNTWINTKKIKPKIRERPKSFIYLLEGGCCLKLGYSTNIKQRIKTLSRWTDELELIFSRKGTMIEEKAIHKSLHISGDYLGDEWYPVYRKNEILNLLNENNNSLLRHN